MAELIAKSALAGQEPVSHGGVSLAEVDLVQITSIAPFIGQEKAVAAALKPLGLAFPAPNTVSVIGKTRLAWTGRGQAFLIGVPPGDWSAIAACTDQSDGWAALALTGVRAAEVLARLVPLDLRAMGPGSCARSSLGHMPMILLGVPDGFEILVFRSMARTAWHELEASMRMLAARKAL
ncbi:sarcosine oxidase subunit gamma [Pseudorhodobacter sp.]|uniref:sarcosine oxidase subunit gamma n=1 Tax=Pseudorhodobacter sp. TaxID=1934400 RepID=UPI0026470F93|nr:sarcosine oxidase subunit gamma [Pseudorhodobacter sp.]MDN5788184.1 sarcosine oxidase subunit gamma [Pseudorhodobacter sp.]